MLRFVAFCLGLPVCAALLGCGGADPLPIREAKKIDQPVMKPAELTAPMKPVQSEPAARALLDEMLAAHTDGKPAAVNQFKSCYVVRSGAVEKPVGRLRMTWKTHMIWPDRYRVGMEVLGQGLTTQTYCMAPGNNWQFPSGTNSPDKAPLAAEVVSTMQAQFEEDSITLLFGLLGEDVLVTRGVDETINGVELLTLHVWTPGLSYAQIGIDKTTKLLRRILYNGRELTDLVIKELLVMGYTDINGVKMPSRIGIRGSGRPLAEWVDLTISTTEPLDAKLFEKP